MSEIPFYLWEGGIWERRYPGEGDTPVREDTLGRKIAWGGRCHVSEIPFYLWKGGIWGKGDTMGKEIPW